MAQATNAKTAEAIRQAPSADRAPEQERMPGLGRRPTGILALQRSAGNQAIGETLRGGEVERPGAGLPPAVHVLLRQGGGRPIDPAMRARLEVRFAHDFSRVRIHSGSEAAASAWAASARAYTVGNDVVFGEGRYAPETTEGRRLLAHELAHVVQQGRGGAAPALDPGGPLEQAAGEAADAVGGAVGPVIVDGASGPGLAREAMTVADVEREAWRVVPGWLKPAVRPAAHLAQQAVHTVIDPRTPVPGPVQPIVQEALRTEEAILAPVSLAAASGAAQTAAPKPAPPPKPAAAKPAPARPALDPKTRPALEGMRDSALDTLGSVKGVTIEAASLVDTLLWAATVPQRAAQEYAIEQGWIDARRHKEMQKTGEQYGFVDPDTGAPMIGGAVAKAFDYGAQKIEEKGEAAGLEKEQPLLFTHYELAELGGSAGAQVALAFVGAEEVQLALKVVAAVGGVKQLATAIESDKDWQSNPDFWIGLLTITLSVLGLKLKQSKAASKMVKLTRVLLASGAFATAALGVWKFYADYKDPKLAAEPEKQKMVLARDVLHVVQQLAHVVRDTMARSRGEAPPLAGVAEDETAVAQAKTGTATPEDASAPVVAPAETPAAPSTANVPAAPVTEAPQTPQPATLKAIPAPRAAPKTLPPTREPRALPAAPEPKALLPPAPAAVKPALAEEPAPGQRPALRLIRKAGPAGDENAPEGEAAPATRSRKASSLGVRRLMNEAQQGAFTSEDQRAQARQRLQDALDEGQYSNAEREALGGQLEALLQPAPQAQARPKAVGDTESVAEAPAGPNAEEAASTSGASTPPSLRVVASRSGSGRGSSGSPEADVAPRRGSSESTESAETPRRGSSAGSRRTPSRRGRGQAEPKPESGEPLFSPEEVDEALQNPEDMRSGKLRTKVRPKQDVDEPIPVASGGPWDDPDNKTLLESMTNQATKGNRVDPRSAGAARKPPISLADAELAGPEAFREAAKELLYRRFSEVEELEKIHNDARAAMRVLTGTNRELANSLNNAIRGRIARGATPEARLVNKAFKVLGIDPEGLVAVPKVQADKLPVP
jgi:hypothetical protein